jgi:hypothetical protein
MAIDNYRFLNVFDIITASIYVPQFQKLLMDIVTKFVAQIKHDFNFDKNSTVLFDVSGSMTGLGVEKGFQYLVLFSVLFEKLDGYIFSNELIDNNKKFIEVIQQIRNGKMNDAYRNFVEYAEEYSSGTALIDSTMELLKLKPEITNLIVITDEVSWLEGNSLTREIYTLSSALKGKKLVIINPQVYKGTVFKENIVSVSGLTPSIMLDMSILYDEAGFIKYIREYKKV